MTTTTHSAELQPSSNLTTAGTRTATKHSTRTKSDYSKSTTTATRSRRPHLCITIRGAGPASGRPVTSRSAVDLEQAGSKIVSGWSGC